MPKTISNYTIRYSEKALSQYEKAAAWYRERSLSAEDNFIAAVDERVRLIKADPHRYRNHRKPFLKFQSEDILI